MKPSLTLLAEAAEAVDSIRLQMLELEHIINQIHASRDYQIPDEYDPPFLDWACSILRSDLPGGLERLRTLFVSTAHQEIRTGWIALFFDMVHEKESALAESWTTDSDMMRKAFEVQPLFDEVWDQVDIQLELDPDVLTLYRPEFARVFDWNASASRTSQYYGLHDHFMNYLESSRGSRYRKGQAAGDVGH